MASVYISFDELPTIGFAHHFNMDNYSQTYRGDENSFEIVYVKSGTLTVSIYDKEYEVLPGSVFVLCRNLPVRLSAANGSSQSHCTVQINTTGSIEFFPKDTDLPPYHKNGMFIPMIVPPSPESETIKRELFSVISTTSTFGHDGNFPALMRAMGILSRLDSIYFKSLDTSKKKSSILEYKIKRYISDNISKPISLKSVAEDLGKSSNHLNTIFKKSNGTGIHQYITKEKVRIIGECIKKRNLSFKDACESVSIFDVSYGYRLFKKHYGITPSQYLSEEGVTK